MRTINQDLYAIIGLNYIFRYAMFITLTELRYVVAVSREKHFGKAAQKCFVSQPTLSVAIKKLEENLGMQIFERDKNHVIETANGLEIIARAQQILESVAKIQDFAKENNDPFANPLKVGAIHTVGPYLFPNLITHINQQKSPLKLLIEEGMTANLSEKLQNGELDAIIVALPFERSNIDVEQLYKENLSLIIPANHPWKNKKSIKPKEMNDQTVLLLGNGHCFRDQVLKICPSFNVSSGDNHSIITSSIETIKYMVASNIGISIVPNRSLQGINNSLIQSLDFTNPSPYREIVLAYRKNSSRKLAITKLINTIQEIT